MKVSSLCRLDTEHSQQVKGKYLLPHMEMFVETIWSLFYAAFGGIDSRPS